jgi:hypothetical protein
MNKLHVHLKSGAVVTLEADSDEARDDLSRWEIDFSDWSSFGGDPKRTEEISQTIDRPHQGRRVVIPFTSIEYLESE